MRRRSQFLAVLVTALTLLHGVPWVALFLLPHWSAPATVAGGVAALLIAAAFPVLMWLGHGRHHRDGAAVVGDTWLGLIWITFTPSLIGLVADAVLAAAGSGRPGARVVALLVLVWALILSAWGMRQARKVPRVVRVQVAPARLPAAFDGFRIGMITDTHFGPLNRTRWSHRVVARLNELDADLVVHAGDLADGSVPQRVRQVAPLAEVRSRTHRLYITGNHEYFSGAAEWTAHMAELGWTVLRNRHVVVERGGDRVVFAGTDDRTALSSGLAGHGADLAAAIAGVDPADCIVLLAHQPREARIPDRPRIDLQLSGHTHGGQIWPFHLLVRLEQKALAGLSSLPDGGLLYTSRGSGFWGPPFRVFAPSEITELTLRAAEGR